MSKKRSAPARRRPAAAAFISHSSANADLAGRIERALEDDGLPVWLDRSEIRAGQLLRQELQGAIKNSRALVLLWSKAAAKSRWVAAEILTAFHLNRFVVACVCDKTPLPYFLQNTIFLNIAPRTRGWVEPLRRAVREAPAAANDVPVRMAGQDAARDQAIRDLANGQTTVTDPLQRNDRAAAQKAQRALDTPMRKALRKWPLEAMILNLAGYHHKNAFMVKQWPAIVAGRPPQQDPLLARAERCFYDSLFADPFDYSALNGLGSILFYERDLDAAEFFIRRAIDLAAKAGVTYPAALHDLQMVLDWKARSRR